MVRTVEPRRYFYGSSSLEFGDFYPSASDTPLGIVAFIHGGFWRAGVGWEGPDAAVQDLALQGWHVWRIQYRTVGSGGGWPKTAEDVANGIDHLTQVQLAESLADSPIVIVGHSAGGHLAVWSLGRSGVAAPAGSKLDIRGAVSLAGVLDLRRAESEVLGEGAVDAFMRGTSDEFPERYRDADPIQNIGVELGVRLVHGVDDDAVPISQSTSYLDAAHAAGRDVSCEIVPGHHFSVITPGSAAWAAVEKAIRELAAV